MRSVCSSTGTREWPPRRGRSISWACCRPPLSRASGSRAGERVIARDRLLVALAETHDRYFEPGEGYHYSNINYQLAAMVVDAATGRSISDLLRERMVEPLGLAHTTIAPPDLASQDLGGYDEGDGGSVTATTDDLVAFGNGGNGGIVSTADELLIILRAIVRG